MAYFLIVISKGIAKMKRFKLIAILAGLILASCAPQVVQVTRSPDPVYIEIERPTYYYYPRPFYVYPPQYNHYWHPYHHKNTWDHPKHHDWRRDDWNKSNKYYGPRKSSNSSNGRTVDPRNQRPAPKQPAKPRTSTYYPSEYRQSRGKTEYSRPSNRNYQTPTKPTNRPNSSRSR